MVDHASRRSPSSTFPFTTWSSWSPATISAAGRSVCSVRTCSGCSETPSTTSRRGSSGSCRRRIVATHRSPTGQNRSPSPSSTSIGRALNPRIPPAMPTSMAPGSVCCSTPVPASRPCRWTPRNAPALHRTAQALSPRGWHPGWVGTSCRPGSHLSQASKSATRRFATRGCASVRSAFTAIAAPSICCSGPISFCRTVSTSPTASASCTSRTTADLFSI